MDEILDFLAKAKTFYFATVDGGRPRVRPFGFAMRFEGRIYLCTGAQKPVFAQISEAPWVELTAMDDRYRWLRVSGKAVVDQRREARAAAFAAAPELERIYSGGLENPNFRVFYLEDAEATISGIGVPPRSVPLA